MAEASWGHSKAKKATRLPPADMEPVRSIPEKGPGDSAQKTAAISHFTPRRARGKGSICSHGSQDSYNQRPLKGEKWEGRDFVLPEKSDEMTGVKVNH